MFADDGEVYQRDAYYQGRDRIAFWLRQDIEGYRDHFDILEIQSEGERVTGLVRVASAGSSSYYKASEYLYTLYATVRDGKIKCLNVGQYVPGLC